MAIYQASPRRGDRSPRELESIPFADLAVAVVGSAMTLRELSELIGLSETGTRHAVALNDYGNVTPLSKQGTAGSALWLGSIGYEQVRDSRDFAQLLQVAGVERVVDVRELPISRRPGYAKTALRATMADAGIEYIHMRALGNPKEYRDLYKSGRHRQGRKKYRRHLLENQREALEELVTLVSAKRTALMCLEHDARVCHRTVIVDALRTELGLEVNVEQVLAPD